MTSWKCQSRWASQGSETRGAGIQHCFDHVLHPLLFVGSAEQYRPQNDASLDMDRHLDVFLGFDHDFDGHYSEQTRTLCHSILLGYCRGQSLISFVV
jgi:hypothetical protein